MIQAKFHDNGNGVTYYDTNVPGYLVVVSKYQMDDGENLTTWAVITLELPEHDIGSKLSAHQAVVVPEHAEHLGESLTDMLTQAAKMASIIAHVEPSPTKEDN